MQTLSSQQRKAQQSKLQNSYKQLLDEFNAKELKTVGNYNLGKLIGKGSFGKVYLATHKLSRGSKVVLKSTSRDDPNLAREIHHHRQFVHPHIARLYEVVVTESSVWLVLEYCPGDELYNHLLKTGPMEPEKVQRIFTQLVGSVSYVHGKSCVHRDLKLENILLDKHGNVKLVDFGFTREYEGRQSYLQTWCGTVCYSAPEMIKGEKYAGEKVDVWSLGIILYALLCGELPYDDDNESVIKNKILKEEPKYPESMPLQAKNLIEQLLSKRPLLRPSLADILQHPWLSEHAPSQQAILKLQQPAPFSTELEKEVLQRMRSAGVDIDQVIENVLAQRCDGLSGWWALLLEKEERKLKRKKRDAEAKNLRRLSAASGRLIGPTIEEADEQNLLVPTSSRGRNPRRRSAELPNLPESTAGAEMPALDGVRSTSTSRPPPAPPPKVDPTPAHPLSAAPLTLSESKTRKNNPFWSQFAQIKRWFKQSGRKSKAAADLRSGKPATAVPVTHSRRVSRISNSSTYRYSNSHVRPEVYRTYSGTGNGGPQRVSLSPSPLTPRSSSYRRSSGLKGRKSTSSSVSSIRSIHQHQHSLSKASSISSNSASVTSPTASASGKFVARSPQASVKVLPATPVLGSFPPSPFAPSPTADGAPRGLSINTDVNASAFGVMPPASPGIMFAKRKRSPFKGPMLALSKRNDSLSRSSSTRRRSGGIIEEEEEEEEDEEDGVELVDEFEPAKAGEEILEINGDK